MILTDAEIAEICCDVAQSTTCDIAYARAIESAILEKIGEPVACCNEQVDSAEDAFNWFCNTGYCDTDYPTPLYKLPEVTK